jgi:hypothetical protein
MSSTEDAICKHIPGLNWPQADEDALRAEAGAWRAMAAALREIEPAPAAAARSVAASNTGAAIDAFERFWSSKYTGGSGAFPALERACTAMAAGLDKYAQAVSDAKRKIEEKAAIAGATLVVGTALAIFTAGISEAAADGAAAAIVAFSEEVIGVTLVAAAEDAIATITAGIIGGVLTGVGSDLVAQAIRVEGFRDGGFSWGELGDATVGGAAGGAIGGTLGFGMKSIATAVTDFSAARPALASVMDGLPTALDSRLGRMATGSIVSGLSAEMVNGHVSPLDLVSGAAGGAVGRRALPDEVRTNMMRGNAFNRAEYPKYGNYNEIRLVNNKVLDSYRPGREIVSRKYTQLADVKYPTARSYISEVTKKYAAGTGVAASPRNVREMPGLVGQRLRGRYYLEVPVQAKPVPHDVLAWAASHHVTIRDITGRVYTLQHPGGHR